MHVWLGRSLPVSAAAAAAWTVPAARRGLIEPSTGRTASSRSTSRVIGTRAAATPRTAAPWSLRRRSPTSLRLLVLLLLVHHATGAAAGGLRVVRSRSAHVAVLTVANVVALRSRSRACWSCAVLGEAAGCAVAAERRRRRRAVTSTRRRSACAWAWAIAWLLLRVAVVATHAVLE